MMMLHFPDPPKLKTKKLIFEDKYFARDSGTLEQLKELSSSRRVIEESINDKSCITDAVAREMCRGSNSQFEQDVQRVDKYLPLLENLVHHVNMAGNNHLLVRWTSNLKIRWSSALTSSCFLDFKGPKFFQIDNLQFELNMMLFLYGSLLREWAHEVLPKDLVQSANLFRKAAGVYHHLAQEVLPSLQPALPTQRPPEATSCVSSIMSLICLAEAQIVTTRKAAEKGITVSLLAKLHYGIVQILDEATVILNSSSKDTKDLSSRFFEFISSCKYLHALRSYKYLAEGLKNDSRIGAAIGVLHHALITAHKSKMPGKESWRLILIQEIDILTELSRKYEHENNFVWNEKIPIHHDLPIPPEGKRIVNFIPYQPQKWERALSFKL